MDLGSSLGGAQTAVTSLPSLGLGSSSGSKRMNSPRALEQRRGVGRGLRKGERRGLGLRSAGQLRGHRGRRDSPNHSLARHQPRRRRRFPRTQSGRPDPGTASSGGKRRGGASGAGPPRVGRLGRRESSKGPGEAVP